MIYDPDVLIGEVHKIFPQLNKKNVLKQPFGTWVLEGNRPK